MLVQKKVMSCAVNLTSLEIYRNVKDDEYNIGKVLNLTEGANSEIAILSLRKCV